MVGLGGDGLVPEVRGLRPLSSWPWWRWGGRLGQGWGWRIET